MSDAPDPAQVMQALKAVSAGQGFNALLGFEVMRVENGLVEIEAALRPELTQHHGFAHGAVVGALADTACAWAAASVAGDVVTSSYTIQFLAPARGQRLHAVGSVLKSGRRQISAEAKVYALADGVSSLVAVALAIVAPVGPRDR